MIKEGIVMNISICDDDIEFVSQMENMIIKYLVMLTILESTALMLNLERWICLTLIWKCP